jgi:F-type H+-transporting ATPase subunit gamma
MRNVVAHASSANAEYKHPYLADRDDVKNVGFIIVSSDRGLCGGLNSNLFRKVVGDMAQWNEKGMGINVCVLGKKASAFFKRYGANVVSEATDLGDAPQLEELVGAIKIMMDDYSDGKIDRLYVVYNDFVNTMTQKPTIEQLIPIVPSEEQETQHHWDYIYEPEAQDIIEALMTRYVESLVYQAVADNSACEQAARMVAMKAATDNAGKLIDELQLVYNKARQAAITQELSEIVGGAAAV